MPVSPEVRANRPITPVRPTPFFAILATILQPRGRCDDWPGEGAHGDRQLATILQPRGRCDSTAIDHSERENDSQPSFSREAVATRSFYGRTSQNATRNHPSAERPLRRVTPFASPAWGGSQPSFSREAVATRNVLHHRAPNHLATILQPRGRCDAKASLRRRAPPTRNHPSAERPLRPVAEVEAAVKWLSQPSFSREAVATKGPRRQCGRRRLATILQPRGRCDTGGLVLLSSLGS